jgi:hypothetical protein
LLRCIGREWHFAAFAAPQHFGSNWTKQTFDARKLRRAA